LAVILRFLCPNRFFLIKVWFFLIKKPLKD
jgi:hypothetical protein